MLQRLRLIATCLCLALLLPNAALGEDEKDDGAPPKDAPAKDAPPKDAPPKDAPPKDAPPSEEPGEDAAPKDDAPKKDAPKKDDPAPVPATTQAAPPAAVPAGMTFLEGGRVRIGSELEYIDALLAGRPPEHKRLFLHETPYHHVFVRPYFMSKFEVTNAQYRRFLKDFETEYDTAGGSLGNLNEIAAELAHLSKDQENDPDQVVWMQIYFSNKDAIHAAFGKKMANFEVKRPDGSIDEIAMARKFRREPLPRTLKLKFFTMRPPDNWPDMDPPKGEEDHPVRYVSYNDAERFAEWAGLHLPSEQEWEWAARGPDGRIFPWGNDWPQNELYANWGGKITDSRYMPTTLAVATRYGANPTGEKIDGKKAPIDGDGRSWCGCHHMVGNVAEWTSSWFRPYPSNRHRESKMGSWVKVIRGGSAGDNSMLVLRPACRNFEGAGPDAPPYPENRFKWAGFRMASYMKSGRDQLTPIIRRATRPKKLTENQLDGGHFIGAVTRNWVESGATPDNHVYVLGRSNAIALIPQTEYLRDAGMEQMRRAWKRPSGFKSERGVRKKSETEYPFWTVAVFHTDIPLDNVQVRKPKEPEDPTKKGKKKKGRRGRGRAKAPETIKGECPPGTYLLGVWFGHLTVMTPSKEFVCFLKRTEEQKSFFDVKKVAAEELAEPILKVDPELDWADLEFSLPLGGKGVDDSLRLIVKARITFEVGSLEAAGTWIQEDPARSLTATLRAAHDKAEAAAASKKPPKKKKDDKKKDAKAKKKAADDKKKDAKAKQKDEKAKKKAADDKKKTAAPK